MFVAHQADECLGEIRVVRQCPKRSSITWDNHGLSFEHSLQNGPAAFVAVNGHWHAAFTISVAWADDGDGELLFAIMSHQQFLTGDLVPRILPIGISQRSAFVDDG